MVQNVNKLIIETSNCQSLWVCYGCLCQMGCFEQLFIPGVFLTNSSLLSFTERRTPKHRVSVSSAGGNVLLVRQVRGDLSSTLNNHQLHDGGQKGGSDWTTPRSWWTTTGTGTQGDEEHSLINLFSNLAPCGFGTYQMCLIINRTPPPTPPPPNSDPLLTCAYLWHLTIARSFILQCCRVNLFMSNSL